MKIITVDKDKFSFLWQGFLMGTPREGYTKLTDQLRAVKVMDKLEAVSEPDKNENGQELSYSTGDQARVLKLDSETLEFEDAEFDLLLSHYVAVPWRLGVMKKAVEFRQILENLKEPAA